MLGPGPVAFPVGAFSERYAVVEGPQASLSWGLDGGLPVVPNLDFKVSARLLLMTFFLLTAGNCGSISTKVPM